MKKPILLFSAVLLILFAAITLLKSRPEAMDPAGETAPQTTAEQEEVRRFWALYRQATAHRIAGRLDEATAAYQEALTLNSRHEDALYYLGNMYLEQGHLAEARAMWERLARLNPNSARAHAQLGDLFFCRYQDPFFDLDAAEVAFKRALEINSEETGPLLRLGQVALVRGDYAGARYFFDAVVGSHYKSVEAHALNGYLAWKQGDPAKAAAFLAEVVRHARPEAPPQGVPGEGDTKTGAAPLVSGAAGCRMFDPFLDGLVDASEDVPHADSLYQALDALLGQVRHRL